MRDMMKMMKQAKDLQKNMEAAQAQLAETMVTGTSGGNAVTVEMTCTHEIKAVKIDPAAVDADDIETLEDLVQTAVADAIRKGQETSQTEMGKLTGGLNIPGLS
ncbi:MAG: YbaB/EbfC family nucleoid-associated protein [Alphaproteobacteria bacterium]|nr:YbaB/EbfC family nucleoid-associated protein [Alphaproteobacteria bacterium]MDD9919928.1 YbaB/EbfC family nucleoid-associated protein [Alphaproteobacteria bacterium]